MSNYNINLQQGQGILKVAKKDAPNNSIRQCEIPWHFAVDLGPFYLAEKPTRPIRTLCQATHARDRDVIRFKPSYIDFHESNYTTPTKIEAWSCIRGKLAPSISCGTNFRGAPLVDETDLNQRHRPYHPTSSSGGSRNTNQNTTTTSKGSEAKRYNERRTFKKEDTILSLTTVVLLVVGAWYLFSSKKKHHTREGQLHKKKQRQQQQRSEKIRKGKKSNKRQQKQKVPFEPFIRRIIPEADRVDINSAAEDTVDDESSEENSRVSVSPSQKDTSEKTSIPLVITYPSSEAEGVEDNDEWEEVGAKRVDEKDLSRNQNTFFVYKKKEAKLTSSSTKTKETILNTGSPEVPKTIPSELSRKSILQETKSQHLNDHQLAINDHYHDKLPKNDDILVKTKITIAIDGMKCGGCASSANNALEQVPGIHSASIDLTMGRATLKCSDTRLDLQAIVHALDIIGLKGYLLLNEGGLSTAPSDETKGPGVIGPSKVKKDTPLMLLDELRNNSNEISSSPSKRRYRCCCGCAECICSDTPLIDGDEGIDINLEELCSRLEESLGWSKSNNDEANNRSTSLQEQIQNGSESEDLRHALQQLDFPCGCGS